MNKEIDFRSEHFDLETIGEGIFAAIHKVGGAAIGNAGIVNLGDNTLVFDTFISPLAAKDLRLAAEILTESPVSYVFNSHYHNDHMRGNQEFSDAQIISTDKTLDLIETAGMAELESDKEASQQYRRYLAEWKNTTDQTAREKSRFWLDYYRVLADSLDGLRLCLPQITFNQQLTISGSARSVHLLTYGGGHTGSDGFLYIPDAGVLFLSDLLFVRCHPFLADGHPENWIAILEKIQTLEADVLVPGHGPVGKKSDIELMIRYIQMVSEEAESEEPIHPAELPAPFNGWEMGSFFMVNLGFMSRWQNQKG